MTEESKRQVRRFTQSHGKGRAWPRHAHRLPPLPGKLPAYPSWSLPFLSHPRTKPEATGGQLLGFLGAGNRLATKRPRLCIQRVLFPWELLVPPRPQPVPPASSPSISCSSILSLHNSGLVPQRQLGPQVRPHRDDSFSFPRAERRRRGFR